MRSENISLSSLRNVALRPVAPRTIQTIFICTITKQFVNFRPVKIINRVTMSQLKESSSNTVEKRPSEQQDWPESKKSRPDIRALPTRLYLDNTVVPILLDGLAALSRERPDDPIDYLISYLQKHKLEHTN